MSRRRAQATPSGDRDAGVCARLSAAAAELPAPVAVVDLDAFDHNGTVLAGRAHGKPIRVATKSLRCRSLIERALAWDGFDGLMCYSLHEALWWAAEGRDDILVAYPSVEPIALRHLGANARARATITTMIDSVEHVDLISRTAPGAPIRVCIDVDASLRIGKVHLGVRRSPLRTPDEVEVVIRRAQERGLVVSGLMFYDAQIAGLPDSSAAVRTVKSRSHRELLDRRAEVVERARSLADLEFVNGGGTGSLHLTGLDPSLTELAAGSGLYAPTLFDDYAGLTLRPSAYFGARVSRRPSPGIVTVFGGGYIASGPAGASRVPTPVAEQELSLIRSEGAGEVQTPLKGPGADRLGVGDFVWFRHAKAGELAERMNEFALIEGDRVVGSAPTYRGEGKSFG